MATSMERKAFERRCCYCMRACGCGSLHLASTGEYTCVSCWESTSSEDYRRRYPDFSRLHRIEVDRIERLQASAPASTLADAIA